MKEIRNKSLVIPTITILGPLLLIPLIMRFRAKSEYVFPQLEIPRLMAEFKKDFPYQMKAVGAVKSVLEAESRYNSEIRGHVSTLERFGVNLSGDGIYVPVFPESRILATRNSANEFIEAMDALRARLGTNLFEEFKILRIRESRPLINAVSKQRLSTEADKKVRHILAQAILNATSRSEALKTANELGFPYQESAKIIPPDRGRSVVPSILR